MNTYFMRGPRVKRITNGNVLVAFLKTNKVRIGIPDNEIAEYEAIVTTAENTLDKVTRADYRTLSMTAQLEEVFKTFAQASLAIKRKYFNVPPLTNADLVACHFRSPELSQDEVKPPTTSCTIIAKNPDPDVVSLHFDDYRKLSPETRAYYGVRYNWGIVRAESVIRIAKGLEPSIDEYKAAAGVGHYLIEAPKNGEIMPHSKYAKKLRNTLHFENESGNTLYLCARYETDKGDACPWGPVVKVVIT
jgi:hypothetical protein